MMRCEACGVGIEGNWQACPLCGTRTCGEATPSPLPDVALTFSRRRVLRALFLASLLVIAGSLVAQLLFSRSSANLGAPRFVWLGIASMWLVVLMAVRKRRNVAKGTAYLVVIIGGLATYWDYLTGWHGWSLDYVVPIVFGSAIVALLITVQVMRVQVGDHIVYSALTVILGLVPLAFQALGWVEVWLPSVICGAVSFLALVILQIIGGRTVRKELSKRLHV